jgi:hypothetical protein
MDKKKNELRKKDNVIKLKRIMKYKSLKINFKKYIREEFNKLIPEKTKLKFERGTQNRLANLSRKIREQITEKTLNGQSEKSMGCTVLPKHVRIGLLNAGVHPKLIYDALSASSVNMVN